MEQEMSENLQLIRSILAEWERGDFTSVHWAHPRIEFAIVDEPGSRVERGVDAMTRTWREFLTAWDDYRVEAREYHELDEERVLVALTPQGRGKVSGLEIDAAAGRRGTANVFHLCRGRVTRLDTYFDRHRALADVGLSIEGEPDK
jgi:hypothetical protein